MASRRWLPSATCSNSAQVMRDIASAVIGSVTEEGAEAMNKSKQTSLLGKLDLKSLLSKKPAKGQALAPVE